MEGKQYNQEVRAGCGSYWTHAWTGIVAGHWEQNWKSLIFTPLHSFKPLSQCKCLANEQQEILVINCFHLALFCHHCYNSVLTLNGLFLETHRLAGWWCKAASCRHALERIYRGTFSIIFSIKKNCEGLAVPVILDTYIVMVKIAIVNSFGATLQTTGATYKERWWIY